MRKSKAETAETRRRIVAAATEEFRKHGLHETGLVEVMAAAGLTQGGFYRHFKSKDQLVAESCAAGLGAFVEKIAAATGDGDGTSGLQTILDTFLSPDHRDDRLEGCPLVSLGSELVRANTATRETATHGFNRLVDVVAKQFPRTKPEIARERAEFIVCAMVGAMTMSRMVTDPDLSTSILERTRRRLAKI